MGASDYKAILKLAKLPNTEVKVSYDTKRTRLMQKHIILNVTQGLVHCIYWIFKLIKSSII